MAISGHRTISTFLRYDIASEQDKRLALEQARAYREARTVRVKQVATIHCAKRRQSSFRKLKRWFAGVETEVEWLVLSGHTFRELQDLVRSSPLLQEVGANWSNRWIAANFAICASVRIRGIVDKDRRTNSLYRVLEQIEADQSVFTRRRFVRRYLSAGGGTKEEAERAFDLFAGRGNEVLDPLRVGGDRKRVAAQLARIKRYVDKRAAHLERGWSRRRLKLRTITAALAAIEKVTKKYYPLFMGRPAPPSFGLHRTEDWKRFFAAEL